MKTAERVELFVKGAIIGHLVGDTLGYCWSDKQGIPDELEMTETSINKIGEYTSLGAFSLATMATINDCGELDLDDLLEKFYDVYIAGYLTSTTECYDVGAVTSAALNRYSNGFPPDRCGVSNVSDADSLGRMLPVALFHCTDPIETIVKKAHLVCTLTHALISDQVICAVYCLIVRNIILQKTEKVFELLEHYYIEQSMSDHTRYLSNMKIWGSNGTIEEKDITAALKCFWISWNSFSKNENDYFFTILNSIKFGDDKNAVGAISGSLGALNNGLNNIPSKYLRTLQLTSEVMEIITKFVNTVVYRIVE